MEITDRQRRLFAELLWNALAETDENNWGDYEEVIATYVQVASTQTLKDSRSSMPETVQDAIDNELTARGEQ